MALPNFIIPGTQKGGTTILIQYLSQHPDIFTAKREVHFFDNNYDKGVGWYKKWFKDWDGEKKIGEKSPLYMYSKVTPERIYNLIPSVKLIFLLRNPTDRAYSQYWMNVRHGMENLSFEDAIREEEERFRTLKDPTPYCYKDRGKYADQIKKYLRFFPRENILVVISEDLRKNTGEWLKEILSFLGVSNTFEFKKINGKIGTTPRNRMLSKGYKLVKKNKLLAKGIAKLNEKQAYPRMEREVRERLTEYFEEYNEQLENLLGLDFNEWWK